MSLFTLGSARAVLVVALVYSFLDVFDVNYIYRILLSFNVLNWLWSPLTQTSLLLSPTDGLASFLKTTLANGVKVVKKVKTSKFRFHLIAIYALGCFRNFSCTPVPTKITLKSPLPPPPNPRETSERMNFNDIDQKHLIWKLFIYWLHYVNDRKKLSVGNCIFPHCTYIIVFIVWKYTFHWCYTCIYWQCTCMSMYNVFMLQCQKVQNKCKLNSEDNIIFKNKTASMV
jgi:hypothetical protein